MNRRKEGDKEDQGNLRMQGIKGLGVSYVQGKMKNKGQAVLIVWVIGLIAASVVATFDLVMGVSLAFAWSFFLLPMTWVYWRRPQSGFIEPEVIECSYCDDKILVTRPTPTEFEEHLEKSHPIKECPYCDYQDRDVSEYERHVAKEVMKYGPKPNLTDFAWIRDYLDKGGLVLTTIKCPQCGANLDLPKEGNNTRCKYCGASIYAQDILEKFKGLLKS